MEKLLNGVNHVAVLTKDMDRFIRFYEEAFGAKVEHDNPKHAGKEGERMVVMSLGDTGAFNVFQVPGNTEAEVQTPMFGRGRIDHFALSVPTREALEEVRQRLIKLGASEDVVTDFGNQLSVFFRDPDGLEAEVCWKKS